ncbi:MAG: hypothetical protein CMJ83_01445 [Planctomycetes bacterium]|nr:hypothetical protein [Planctomycetota bacterium]
MSGKITRNALLLMLASIVACPLFAQVSTQETLDAKTLVTLHEAGVPASELDKLLDRHGVPLVDEAGLRGLRSAGFPPAVLARISQKAARAIIKKLTVDDVVALIGTGVGSDAVIKEIRRTDSRFDLTIDDLVTLARQRIPVDVIKEMRARGQTTATVQRQATSVTVADVIDMTVAEFAPAEIIRRIRKTDSRYELDIDALLELGRKNVAPEVLKELWARQNVSKKTELTPPGTPASTTPSMTAGQPTPGPSFVTHRESGGGFSISVPEDFVVYRETRQANSLVSFTDRNGQRGDELPDAELQIMRYRSRKPEWLVETNIDAIGRRFLTMLRSSYVKKGLSLTHSDGVQSHASGRPCRIYDVGSSSQDGATREGRLLVTWFEDQVYVLSYAVRADLVNTRGQALDHCLRSFTLERDSKFGEPENERDLAGMFELWREAVTHRDFALYRDLCPSGHDTAKNRASFVDLANRLADPRLRLSIGKIDRDGTKATVNCKIIGPGRTDTLALAFERGTAGYRLSL